MNLSAQLIVVDNDRNLLHDTGCDDHPEIPARIQAIRQALDESPYRDKLQFVSSRSALIENLRQAHSQNYLLRFEEAVLSGKTHIDHPDNQICYESYQVACYSAGAGLVGIDLIEQGKTSKVFCLVRPPGHHAEPSAPFGFCFINNCVVAARYWQQKYGIKRILVFDFDAHHGNGIQSAFEEEANTFYISIHEHPSFSYPGTGYADEHGMGEGKGSILNIPLSPGTGDEPFMEIMASLPHQLTEWQPQAIIVAAGFDGHMHDDMSGLSYSTALYRRIGYEIRDWADKYCNGRVISLLEGGYELSVLGDSVEAYLGGILGKAACRQ